MTPLEAFQDDIQSIFDDYRNGDLSYESAIFALSERADILREAYITSDIPDEILQSIFEAHAELRLLGVELENTDQDTAEVDIRELAEAMLPDFAVREQQTNRMHAELLWRIPPSQEIA